MSKSQSFINPGINQNVNVSCFKPVEQELISRVFGIEFYVTNGGGIIHLGSNSVYRYFLIKFPDVYKEQFNIEREVVVLFSDYKIFEPRTLDAFEEAFKRHQELRIERICTFLVSKDNEIENKIGQLLSNSTESQVVVPFNYYELSQISDTYFFRNRIKKYFYSRDLFSYESALRKDTYFFGRNDIVHSIVNRHRHGENSGVFGLRKTGKTSIIFAIQRILLSNNETSVYIDCQDTGFYMRRWNTALYYIIQEIKKQNRIEAKLSNESEYTELNCSKMFEKDLITLKQKNKNKQILIIFDEVERITFELSSEENWKNGNDFIHFWRTIRSIFQKNEKLFTYLIVSTNPKSVETSTINGEDNPLFSQIPFEYIKPFTVHQTEEMVSRLANIMGMEFDDIIYSKLTEDFGGHPFLIRMVCSLINKICQQERPVRIDKTIYQNAKERFYKEYGNYVKMVITVLKEHYSDEYEMLQFLALDDYQTFNEFATCSNDYINHLVGYNIIDRNNNLYFFKIEAIKQYLIEKNKYKKLNLTLADKLKEISERRNELEPRLRTVVRTLLYAKYGENEAKKIVLDIFGEKRKTQNYNTPFKGLFNPKVTDIYFEDLRKIISKEWDVFNNVFCKDKNSFMTYMNVINKDRNDAHAKDISDDEMQYFRICATKIEDMLKDYLAY